MSRAERFFTPKSLARVAEAVEWPEVLTFDKAGVSDQSEYMKALAILYERWMRNWTLPDFGEFALLARDRNWLGMFQRALSSVELRCEQFVGFLRGLWAGANPGWPRTFGWPLPPEPAEPDPQLAFQRILEAWYLRMQSVFAQEDEEGGAEWPAASR